MTADAAPTKGYLAYRPELDGMRGLGLLTVLWHHIMSYTDVPIYRGGFYALDTFFVLSGYLITTLLIREWDQRRSISIKNFYVRRGLRLLPALLLTIPFGAVVAAVVQKPFHRPYWQSAGAALSYVANWFELKGSIRPLQHTWTLSVEEQYYLLWSAFLVIAFRRGMSKRALGVLALAGALGMAVMRFGAFELGHIQFAVLSTFTRPDGVLIGSALALLLADAPDRIHVWFGRRTVGLAAAALVVTGTFVLDFQRLPYYVGGLTLFNLCTAVLIAHMLSAPASLPRRILGFRPFSALGRISYGVYLYHLPLLYLVVGHPGRHIGRVWVPIFFALAIGAGALSYKFVEKPALRLKSRFGSMSKLPAAAAS